MGQMENVAQELESSITEPSKGLSLSEDKKCGHLTPGKNNLNFVSSVADSLEQKTVKGADTVGKEISSTEESLGRFEEVKPNLGGISNNLGAENAEPVFIDTGNLEAASHNWVINENFGVSAGASSANHGNGILYHTPIDVDIGFSLQSRKRGTQPKVPVTSPWSLRSKSQEKAKAPDPTDTVKEGNTTEEKKRRGRKKKQMNKTAVNEFSRTRTHLRYLLHRIAYEQNLIDAYSAEGWKGQSLEKLRPEKELERAKSHILRYKLRIRALFQQLDQSLSAGKLPASLFDSQGEIDSEDIFCAKCGSKDVTLENDIILCDGACERGFHQLCVEPPLLKEDIPPGDEGWLCPGCDCKVDCIDMLKDFQGNKVTIIDSWEKIFPEAAAVASGKTLLDDCRSSTDDSEDDDYDPDKPEIDDNPDNDGTDEEEESSSDDSSYYSASDDLAPSHNNEKCPELPSDDSEDDDFDPSAVDKQVKQDSSGSDFTSDSEDLGALLEDDTAPETDFGIISPSSDQGGITPLTGFEEENSKAGRKKRQSLKEEVSYLMKTSGEAVSRRRQVERLDYKKLNDETYGNSSSGSSDEDFDDNAPPKRRRTSHEKTVVMSPDKTKITMNTKNTRDGIRQESKHLPKRSETHSNDETANELPKDFSASVGTKKSANKRLGEAATQGLYASFNENQYPDRATKENLANELGLTFRQVNKWFENARWSFNHPRMESNATEKHMEPKPNTSTNNIISTRTVHPQGLSAKAAKGLTTVPIAEHFATTTSGENSSTPKSRKRKDKSKQALDNAAVTNKSVDPNTPVNNTQSPQIRASVRRTRSGNSVV